jgi:hypothetical protein
MHVNAAHESIPRTLHLVPRAGQWRLLLDGEEQPLGVYGDLGRALDAATRGPELVRVVVHSEGAA